MSDEEQALLQEVHAPWEFASQLEQTAAVTTVPELLASRGDAVLRTLQQSGVSKLGEFEESSEVVFPVFGKEAILTLGSPARDVEFEGMWRRHLHTRLKGSRPSGWSSSVVLEAFVVNIRGATNPDKDGLVQPLLKRWQSGAVGLPAFGIPAVQAVVDFKWHKFARRLLLGELAFFALWLFSFFAFTILFQDEDETAGLAELLASGRGKATVAAELVALLSMSPFLVMHPNHPYGVLEWGTIRAYGAGWFNLWNGLDACTYLLQVAITLLHLSRRVHTGYLSIACALQCILLLFRVQYFSRVFTATRFAFLEAVKEAISAISIYLAFMLLIMLGFAVAFHVLFRKDQTHEEFATLTNAFLTMYANQDSLLDLGLMRSSHNPVAAVLLAVAYAFVMGMVIVNMLIGLMSNALERTGEHQGMKALLNKAQIIDELESTMPRWLENKFVAAGWYPEFVHILRIDKDRLDQPGSHLASMWTVPNADEDDGGSDGLAAKLDAMQAQLDRLEVLLAGKLVQQQQQLLLADGAAASAGSVGPDEAVQ